MEDGQKPSAVIRMVSKLEDREMFLDAYQAFVDAKSVIVFTRDLPELGARQRFSVHLKDGEVVLAGEGEVAEFAPRTDGSNKPPKMRLNIVSLDPGGDAVLADLLDRKRRAMRRSGPPAPPPARRTSAPEAGKATAASNAETRTPGASDTLPANPLSSITDETLEGFVECVLHDDYEPAERDSEAHARTSTPSAQEEPPEVHPVGEAASRSNRAPTPVPAAAEIERSSPTPQPTARGGLGTNILVALLAVAVGVFGTLFYLHYDAGEGTRPPALERTPKQPPVATRPAPAPPAVTNSVDESRSDPAPVVAVADPQPSDPPPTDQPDPPPTETAPQPSPDDPPPTDPGATTADSPVDDGACHVVVKSYEDAFVYVDGKRIGHPPLDEPVPCGNKIAIAIKHPRYDEVERTVVAEPGKPAEVDVTLVRPHVSIKLSSVPPGATLSVDGNIVGRAPAKATIQAYTPVWVTASLDGYKPWSKRIRVSKRGGSFTARLAPIPGAH